MICVYRLSFGVPNPLLGPKGVRIWLVTRGVVGLVCAYSHILCYLHISRDRFFGIFGLYYSIQHMPLSDATVLTFLAPTMTALIGFLCLKEPLSWKQGIAGRGRLFIALFGLLF
jgi:drug/metabolite transporter (DMT)-like permease